MNLFYKSIVITITLFCFSTESHAKSYNYFEKEEIKQKDVVIEVGVKQSIPIEYKSEVKKIYDEFCQKHRVSMDGDVVESDSSIFGEALGTDNDSYAYFCKFVTSTPILRAVQLKERCIECKGSGIKYIYPSDSEINYSRSNAFGSSTPKSILDPIKTDCEACSHTGYTDIIINFKIICISNNIPKAPKTLRQKEQLKLDELVAKGEVDARTTYAAQLIDSTPIVTKDLKKAKLTLEELLVEGHQPALEQYLRVLNQDSVSVNGAIDVKKIFIKASLILANKKTSPELNGNYLTNLVEDILAKNIASNLKNKTLKPSAFNVSTIITDFKNSKNLNQFNEIEKALIPWIESNNPGKVDDKTLLEIKKIAQSLQPAAFYLLGTISENGISGSANRKAAYLFYVCAEKISNNPSLTMKSSKLSDLESVAPTQEILSELSEFKIKGKCTATFIDAIYNIN
jgi:TPR repeat protein